MADHLELKSERENQTTYRVMSDGRCTGHVRVFTGQWPAVILMDAHDSQLLGRYQSLDQVKAMLGIKVKCVSPNCECDYECEMRGKAR